MQINWYILIALVLYFAILVTIGLVTFKKDEDMEGYALGGRALGPWVTSMSAEASDMSGWMLMGLPGYAYMAGISAFWIAIGLILGTWANWAVTARRLRVFTQVMNNSITLPEYFDNRFMDTKKSLRIASAFFIFIFFLIYTSSSFVAGGKLFNTAFGMDYHTALFFDGRHRGLLHLDGRFCGRLLDGPVPRLSHVLFHSNRACNSYVLHWRRGAYHNPP